MGSKLRSLFNAAGYNQGGPPHCRVIIEGSGVWFKTPEGGGYCTIHLTSGELRAMADVLDSDEQEVNTKVIGMLKEAINTLTKEAP